MQEKSDLHKLALAAYPYCWALCYFSSVCFIYEIYGPEEKLYPHSFSISMLAFTLLLGTALMMQRVRELFLVK